MTVHEAFHVLSERIANANKVKYAKMILDSVVVVESYKKVVGSVERRYPNPALNLLARDRIARSAQGQL